MSKAKKAAEKEPEPNDEMIKQVQKLLTMTDSLEFIRLQRYGGIDAVVSRVKEIHAEIEKLIE